ncbi:CD63 antigen-like isoform X2 [Amphiura filiformis]|uniref:CD63 antigen-like isoform X2 n=1 Tax=Amphiura filiformis TaxID=82378 RepID=UPI003B20F258
MAVGCGAKIAKMLLFIINFCVWAVGIVLIAVGAYVMIEADKYSYLFGDEDTLTTVAGIIIGTGCFIFFVGFCACCGAIKEIVCLLQVYAFLIVLVIILEVVAAILAFVFQDDLIKFMEENINKIIEEEYDGSDNAATQSIDLVQKDFNCCGATGYADWDPQTLWGSTNAGLAVPESCCKDYPNHGNGCNAGTPGNPTSIESINVDGCVDAFTNWIQDNYLIVGGVCLGLLVFEILALIFSCCLISNIKNGDIA